MENNKIKIVYDKKGNIGRGFFEKVFVKLLINGIKSKPNLNKAGYITIN